MRNGPGEGSSVLRAVDHIEQGRSCVEDRLRARSGSIEALAGGKSPSVTRGKATAAAVQGGKPPGRPDQEEHEHQD